MKIKQILAAAVLVSFSSLSFAEPEDLTSNADKQILVKNNFGQCVTVKANRNLTGCGDAPQVERVVETQNLSFGADAFFDFDKYNLKPAGVESLNNLVAQLQSNQANLQKITIVGHTDSKGSDAYNQRLSERRAATVGNYLIQQGIPADRVEAYGDGERSPVADNRTAEGRARNRRVEIAVQAIVERPVQQAQ